MSSKVLKRRARAASPADSREPIPALAEPAARPERARQAAPRPTKVVGREVLLARDRARGIVEKAERHGREVLEHAAGEAEALRRRAVEEGRAEGLAEWQSRLAELAAARDNLVQESEPRLVELALRLAEKVLRQRLDDEPASFLPMVHEALQVLRGAASSLVLRVHPCKAPAFESSKRELLARDPRWQRLDVVVDETLDLCGCRIESEIGVIDVGVETQLAALERALLRGERR